MSYGEDVLFNLLLLFRPEVVVYEVPAVLYFYSIRRGSAVSENRSFKRVQLCYTALSYAKHEKNKEREAALIIYSIKRGLSTRFDVRTQKNCAVIVKQCNDVISDALRAYRRARLFSMKEYAVYETFFRAPFLYSAFRLLNDPSLLRMKNIQDARTDPA